jgi:hypothetical protein
MFIGGLNWETTEGKCFLSSCLVHADYAFQRYFNLEARH